MYILTKSQLEELLDQAARRAVYDCGCRGDQGEIRSGVKDALGAAEEFRLVLAKDLSKV
jgi:hypothetical protein